MLNPEQLEAFRIVAEGKFVGKYTNVSRDLVLLKIWSGRLESGDVNSIASQFKSTTVDVIGVCCAAIFSLEATILEKRI